MLSYFQVVKNKHHKGERVGCKPLHSSCVVEEAEFERSSRRRWSLLDAENAQEAKFDGLSISAIPEEVTRPGLLCNLAGLAAGTYYNGRVRILRGDSGSYPNLMDAEDGVYGNITIKTSKTLKRDRGGDLIRDEGVQVSPLERALPEEVEIGEKLMKSDPVAYFTNIMSTEGIENEIGDELMKSDPVAYFTNLMSTDWV
jgi:hypothetical protein